MWSLIEGKLLKLFLLSSEKCFNKQLLDKNGCEKFHRSGILNKYIRDLNF